MRWLAASLVALVLAPVDPAAAGVFMCSTDPTLNVPGRINHVHGYTGATSGLTVTVCVDPSASDFVPYVQEAIALWNDRTVVVPNCSGFCNVFDEPALEEGGVPQGTGVWDTTSILLHELGHCAFGLDHTSDEHPDVPCENPVATVLSDFTMSYDEQSIGLGTDLIPGTVDDVPVPLPGTRVSHWFRPQINDPYLPGPAVVDNTTYTRVIQQLPPAPHHWPANGNRRVGVHMGYGNAQSVMFGGGSRRTTLAGFIPDDVNTVAYGQAGLDEVIGQDDYTWTLVFSETCTGAQVKIRAVELDPGEPASCAVDWTGLPIEGEPTIRHYALDSSLAPSTLYVHSLEDWSFKYILWDDFEIGSTDFWSETVPLARP